MKLPYDTRTSDAAALAELYDVLVQRAAVDADGRLSVRFPPRRSGAAWLVRRCVVQGPTDTQAQLYTGEVVEDLALADGTLSGDFDVADNYQPLYVPPATPLIVVWTDVETGANVAGDAIARVELEEVR